MTRAGWYPLAGAEDLADGHIVDAVLDGRPLAVWRGADRIARAWENRCPHRGVRLSIGSVVGDELVCRYHGWRFAGADGRCTRVPAHPNSAPPSGLRIQARPVREAAGIVWCDSGEGSEFVEPEPGIVARPLMFAMGLVALRGAMLGALGGSSAIGEAWLRASLPHEAGGWTVTLLLRPAGPHECWVHGLVHAGAPARPVAIARAQTDWLAGVRRLFENSL